ncbi:MULTISPECIES: FAD:protein FMN transferase [unclassified Cryobacterium]|uniref:FAD:protein FMN transferase n=1 Tax=unclassified Cryobacterium TaxID=2649013 RepID=UPI001F53FC03|nr:MULTISPECIES: FAD:protein FMN transferase [unclassified Cryobacterium]
MRQNSPLTPPSPVLPGGSGVAALLVETMGTVVSIRLGATAGDAAALDGGAQPRVPALETRATVEGVFRRWDEQFSLYRPDSELSRVNRGQVRLTQASDTLRVCYALALDWRDRTDGVFTPHRADGAIDLSGVVKSLAIQEAGDLLAARGAGDWSLNAGGDILVSGHQAPGQDWLAAIVDPADRQALLASVPLARPLRAVASSGSAERGEHIWTTVDGGVSPYRQVSVFGRDIVTADVLATTIIAGGEDALNRSTENFEIEVLAVLRDGSLLATPGLRAGPA